MNIRNQQENEKLKDKNKANALKKMTEDFNEKQENEQLQQEIMHYMKKLMN